MSNRREMLKQTLLGGMALGVPAAAQAAPPYRQGFEGHGWPTSATAAT
ncbi:hypothetical protein [Duganella sp. BuS-21]